MKSKWSVALGAFILLIVGVVPRGEQQTPPPAQPPAAGAPAQPPAQAGRGGRGGGIEAEIAAGADFSPRPPVTRLDPAAQQKLFLLPPGYKIEPVLTDPLIEDPVGVTFDGNGRMYVLEMRSYMQDADGSNSRAPISRISRHEDTDGDGKYDKHTVFVDKMVMPRIAFPLGDGVILALETDNRDMYKYTDTDGDGVVRQERAVLSRRRPRHEHGVAAGRPDVGHGQLALHDLQPVPPAHRAGRQDPARRDRLERRAVVVGAGQLRQDVVGRRRRRDRSGQLPGADRLRRVQRQGQLRARLPGALAGAGRHRRHAGRHAPRPHARWHAEPLHGGLGRRNLPRPPPSERHGRRSLLHRTGRPHRPAREDRRHRRPDAAAQRLSASPSSSARPIRSSVRSPSPTRPTARST